MVGMVVVVVEVVVVVVEMVVAVVEVAVVVVEMVEVDVAIEVFSDVLIAQLGLAFASPADEGADRGFELDFALWGSSKVDLECGLLNGLLKLLAFVSSYLSYSCWHSVEFLLVDLSTRLLCLYGFDFFDFLADSGVGMYFLGENFDSCSFGLWDLKLLLDSQSQYWFP